uniref:Serine-rich adhesin for platelets-like n=2 Tax=Salarias fasciatus TaxID=181472 RepID=A0A672I1E0_SALFA
MSKSSFGLHSQGIEEQQEDLSQMKLDQTNTKRFSMSEPELDTSGAFDIPSPPPVANNQSESYFTLTSQSQTESNQVLTNGFDVHQEPRKAPIASIPEAQLDNPDPQAEKKNVPNDFKSTVTKPEIPPEVKTQPDPAASASSTSARSNLPERDESSARPDARETADQSSLPYLDSKNNPAVTDPAVTDPAPRTHEDKSHLGADAADATATGPEVSLPDSKSAIPETATASAVPLSPEIVYGALYDSLFPQNFTAEVLSSLSKSSSKVETETRLTETETVTVRSLESHTEADATRRSQSDANDVVDEANSSRVYAETRHSPTKREIVMIKTLNERHTESVLLSDSNHRIKGEKPGEVLTEYINAEIKKPVTVSTLNEIHSESGVFHSAKSSSHEAENITAVDDTVESFVTLREKSAEVSVPQKMSPPEIKKAIMVKTLYELNTEADPGSSWSSASRDSDSTVPTTNNSTDKISSLDEKTNEETDRETKKQAIMIKTCNEIHSESCVILSPKGTPGELDWTVGEIEETVGGLDLARIGPEAGRLENEKPVADDTPEIHVEGRSAQKSDSIVRLVKEHLGDFHSIKDKSAETVSRQILTDGEVPEPEGVTAQIPGPEPKPVMVKTSRTWISDQSDSAEIDNSADSLTSVGGNLANSSQILTDVGYTEINKELCDENQTEGKDLHFQVSSSLQSEENKVRDPVEFHSANQNPVETLYIITETKKPDMVEALNEINTRGSSVQAEPGSIHGTHDTIRSFVSMTDKTAASSEFDGNVESLDLPDSGSQQVDRRCIPQSESSHSYSEMKPDLAPDSSGSVPVPTNAAPPMSDCATSQGTDARVTDSERRDILPEQLVGDGASADARSPSPVKGVVLKIRTESLSDRPGRMEGAEGAASPSYLSIGSEDGATMEVYYSAEEGDESGDELFTMDTREESFSTGGGDEGQTEGVIVEMRPEGDERTSQEEARQPEGEKTAAPTKETGMNQLLGGSDAKSLEKKDATAAQIKEEGEEEVREEELPATPVQQVSSLMVCDFAPPGEGEEAKCSAILEKEDHEEEQLPSPEGQCLADRDNRSSENIHASSSGKQSDRDTIPPEAEEPVSLSGQADESDEARGGSSESSGVAMKTVPAESCGAAEVTHGAELQSDAAQVEHNRAPEWADPIAQSPDTHVKVAVRLSEPNADARRPDTEAAEAVRENQERPGESQPHLNEGSLTASSTAESEKDSKMSSGYSSLSTKLSFRTSALPKEDESKLRVHKLSLIKEDGGGNVGQSTADSSETSGAVTESGEAGFSSEYKWKNRFEGVSQYVPRMTENSSFSDSLSSRISESSSIHYPYSSYSSSSSSSTLPEAPAYKHLSEVSAPSPEEHSTLGGHLPDRTAVFLERDSEPAGRPSGSWRRSYLLRELEEEHPAAPAASRPEAAAEQTESGWDSQQLPALGVSSSPPASGYRDDHEDEAFTGVFKATLVQLVPDPAAPPSTPPASPEDDFSSPSHMESLVDTLKSMGPSMRPRGMALRPPAPTLMSSLPPIVEDATSPVVGDATDSAGSPVKPAGPTSPQTEVPNGQYVLPADLGLRKNIRDLRSPLELMKQSQEQQQQPGTRNLSLQLRASTSNSIVMKSSDSSPDEAQSPVQNGNGVPPSPSSRLDNSVLFGSYRSSSIDQTLENGKSHRPLFRTGSLPDTRPASSRISAGPKELGEPRANADPVGSRSERLSFLLNASVASVSSTGSLPGSDDLNSRISRPPSLGAVSPPAAANSPARVLTSSASLDLPKSLTSADAPLSIFGQMPGIGAGAGTAAPPLLQRSFSSEALSGSQSPLFSNVSNPFQSPGSQFQSPGSQFQSPGSQFQSPGPQFQSPGSQFQNQEPDRNLLSKYRAFPDAYLTKEKEHGKLNPRPGKMYVFDRPGMCGQRLEIRSDIVDATSWELQETISIRVVRGGWVLYEKPEFKGEKIALDEGDIELTYPFGPPEEPLQDGQQEAGPQQQNGEQGEQQGEQQGEARPARRFIIGSIRRAVRDYSVPDISLFPEENAEGKKVVFRDTSDDARIFGFPIKANSIIINAGLWLVYAQPFFQGVPRVLEVGGYSNPAAWGVEQPYVGSLHPLKVGEPRVENLSEPKIVIYDKPYFTGKSRTIMTTMRDFMTRVERQQTAFMYSVGSLKVLGGIWVGYEKEGFRGHQYLLEEGEYHDWRVWGGCNAELRSVRVIRADLTDPLMVMFEQPEEDQEGVQEENTFEVTEAIPDVELFEYKTSTRSIHVLSGAWIAYSHVDFSGNQYVLEKGFYNNCADWGSADTRICSVQPILLAPGDSVKSKDEILLYSEPDFQGECHVFNLNQETLPDKLLTKSCRVARGSWVLYENYKFAGAMFVLSEGDYPNLTSMGCPPGCFIRSAKVVPMLFSVPSISLFGLEGLEGREITMENEVLSMLEEGFNNHILSVRVNSGCWVICEYSNYRGRQFLLEPIEITNWPKFSALSAVGSMYPVRPKRRFFRVKNRETGNYLSVQGGVEEMKSGRVVAAPQVEPMTDIWYYQEGLLKNKMAPDMALQVMGNVEAGAKVVLWTETRQPIQTWTAQTVGLISSITFPGFILDVKGGKTYDKDHVVIMPEGDERPSQQWKIELL